MTLVSLFMVVIGVILTVVSALADVIELGQNPGEFGPWQLAGVIAGVVLLLVGSGLYWRFVPRRVSPRPAKPIRPETMPATAQMPVGTPAPDSPPKQKEEP